MKHPLIIGAGGVTSYLLPVLIKSFHLERVTLVDKDVLEKRNLDRQLFHPDQVGVNKALALANMMPAEPVITVLEEWFTTTLKIPESVDAIICCADNHMARYAAINKAIELDVMAYIGGNEYLDNEAYAFHRDWIGSKKDPLVRYPNIATDETGSPFRCTGEALEIFPQLAVANLGCAAKLAHLVWVYERWLPDNAKNLMQRNDLIQYLPYELVTSTFTNTHA